MHADYRLLPCLLCFLCFFETIQGQSSAQNYVLTRTMLNESGTEYIDEITYYDGLVRPIETVLKAASPSKSDIITMQEYDITGKLIKKWLPTPKSGTGGYVDIRPTARVFYADTVPYSRTEYEASPLNRAVREFGPGQIWHTAQKSVSTDRSLPFNSAVASDVRSCALYAIATNNSLQRKGLYAANELFVSQTVDEDGNTSYTFTDKSGKTILERAMNGSEQINTYYVYDDYGNRRYVLPPAAADLLTATTTWDDSNATLKDFAYIYKYDGRNRCIAKKLPGAEWIYSIYDNADRLIFTQDGERRDKGEWLFTIPDALGRAALTGICKNTFNYAANPLNSLVKAERSNATNAYKGYGTPTGVTLTSPMILLVSYYDDYAFLGYNGIPNTIDTQYTIESGYGVCYGDHQAANKYKNSGLLTGTLTAQLLTNGAVSATYLYSVMYFDDKGQLVQARSNNHLVGGVEKEYVAYNFTGQPTQKKHVHAATGKTTQTEVYKYTYDHAGRLLTTTHLLNSGAVMTLAANTYDEVGRLATTKANGQANLQKTYAYNIRSWIQKITNTHFVEDLTYTYGGNIQTQQWKQATKTRKYTFAYDGLSRLKSASYTGDGTYGTTYTYDKHGNITRLTRSGNIGTSTYGVIDNLTMTYTGNQLTKVEDTAANPPLSASADFKNGSTVATEYTYDKNGNMKTDLNKGMTNIEYNLLNLPRSLVISGTTNAYVYTASGAKLSVSKGTAKTDYVGNMIYENGTFKRMRVDGGYYEGGAYYFYIQDHLGNNRIVANNTGATIVQSTQYYPFGMAFADGTGETVQLNKYNDKELDSERGLNLYDYMARLMMPDLGGRFTSMDPLAEKYYSWSPYAFCVNNPMRFIDPDGRSTNVTLNPDGTYTVVRGGNPYDGDNNIYVGYFNPENNFMRTSIIGVTATSTSFYDSEYRGKRDNGKWFGIIDPFDKGGRQFLKDLYFDRPGLWLYMTNAKGFESLDFKRGGMDRDTYEKMNFEEKYALLYRGTFLGFNKERKPVYGSARDVGNIGAGFIAGASDIPWWLSRIAFDTLESYQKGTFATEGATTQNAQYLGWLWGNAFRFEPPFGLFDDY